MEVKHDKELLQIIKDDLAIEVGWKSFRHMVENVNLVPHDVAAIAKRYAEAIVRQEATRALEREKVLVEALKILNDLATGYKKLGMPRGNICAVFECVINDLENISNEALANYEGKKEVGK